MLYTLPMMRVCNKCDQTLPVEDFYRNGARIRGQCKRCHIAVVREKQLGLKPAPKKERLVGSTYQRKRAWARSLKGAPCMDCGVSYPPWVMDWDHRPGTVKLFSPGLINSYSKKEILAEIAKCDLVCSNCHRQRTHDRESNEGQIAATQYLIRGTTPPQYPPAPLPDGRGFWNSTKTKQWPLKQVN